MRCRLAEAFAALFCLICSSAFAGNDRGTTTPTSADNQPDLILAQANAPASDSDSLRQEVDSLRERNDQLTNRLSALEERVGTGLASWLPSSNSSQGSATSSPAIYTMTPSGSWVAGVSAYILKPYFTGGNPAYFSNDGISPTFSVTNFQSTLSATPAYWIGYVGASGFGVQANFFSFYQSNSTGPVTGSFVIDPFLNAAAVGGSDFLMATSTLRLTTFDFEGTKQINFWDCSWKASAGLRYLSTGQNYESSDSSGFTSSFNSNFNGVGPTLALAGRHAAGASGFGFYGNARGAVAFGKHDDALSGSLIPATYVTPNSSWSVVPTAQMEFGVDYRRELGWGILSFETGMVGMAYFGVGGLTSGVIFMPGNFDPSSTLGLFGLRSSVGITF